MTTTNRQRVSKLVRWTARLWSLPLIIATFFLAVEAFIPVRFNFAGNHVAGVLSSIYAMSFAVAFVVAWHWERIGGGIALVAAVAFKVWFSIRWGHLGVGLFGLLFWPPTILFLISSFLNRTIVKAQKQEPIVNVSQTPQIKPRHFFALPQTGLGWWSLLIGTGFFVFIRLFWMQATAPGRDRSTFFSDPINAGCLIGAFGSPIIGMVLALVAIIWKRERSLLFVPLLLLGLFALLWALAVLSGANA